ncbi:Tripartite ATP-independent transporter, DctQ component [Shimia gijangensis]|uniref:TRAP transporter small permease protein n=1 Tax=Shimia gijangensis TaxID=1470563 RepID=A0A1M6SUM9_9RHOB|nr:TRAP transporter small permease subunit [Shimia gijangensis]SHK48278.1 Tripartite ATP-independent transporter, DctQ component [Shimia gijangensis]
MTIFENLQNRLFGAARILALVGFSGLLILAILTSLDVAFRWGFAYPIHGVNDVSSVVMAVVIAACIPANLVNKQSISVEVLGSLAGQRGRLAIVVFASFCTMVFIGLMAWQFVPYAADLLETGQRTWVLAWKVWPWWFFACGCIIFAAVVQAVVLLTDIGSAIRGSSLPPKKNKKQTL